MTKPTCVNAPIPFDQIVESLLNPQYNPDILAAITVRSLLEQGQDAAIDTIYLRLAESDPDTAEMFISAACQYSCILQSEDQPDSHLFTVSVATEEPITLSPEQCKLMVKLIHHSGFLCKAAKVFIHPTSVNLDNISLAGPAALWHAHQQIPMGKKLSPLFWQSIPDNPNPLLQTFIGVIQVPDESPGCIESEHFTQATNIMSFNDKASQRLFKGKYMVSPPMLLFDVLNPHSDEDGEGHDTLFQSLLDHIDDAMIQLAGEDYEAQIEESEDSLTMTICADTGECMESPFPYTEKGLSRAEAYMMVYDALKIAGVGAIILNDEEDPDDVSDTPLITH
jgi:hypothetical protein